MAFRHVLILSTSLLAPATSFAQETDAKVADFVENGKQAVECVVNANAVYLHSGAGTNYYTTGKLSKGDKIVVVGHKFDWLKVVPPEGSFSYVAQAFVERMSDGKKGRVTRPDLNVRCGSTLNETKAIVQTKLPQGAEVEIIGEKDEYFMIKPPEGAYLYVNKQYVDPVATIAQAPATPPAKVETPAAPMPEKPAATEGVVAQTPGINGEVAPSTQPAGIEPDQVAAAPSTTQPSADAEFERLEAAFSEASTKTIEEQPIAELQTGYGAVVKDAALPETLRRTAEFRIKVLQARAETKAEMESLRKSQEASAQRRMALKAEQDELAEQIKKSEVKMFAAVGTLNTSSLQQSKGTLYRLCDPATGRTIVYIRTDDATKYAGLLGQFIGVKGEVATETGLSMKVISPVDAEAVDQNTLYTKIAAEIVPPSMVPKINDSETASTISEQQPQP